MMKVVSNVTVLDEVSKLLENGANIKLVVYANDKAIIYYNKRKN